MCDCLLANLGVDFSCLVCPKASTNDALTNACCEEMKVDYCSSFSLQPQEKDCTGLHFTGTDLKKKLKRKWF